MKPKNSIMESGVLLALQENNKLHDRLIEKQQEMNKILKRFLYLAVIVVILAIAGLIYLHETSFLYWIIRSMKTITPVRC